MRALSRIRSPQERPGARPGLRQLVVHLQGHYYCYYYYYYYYFNIIHSIYYYYDIIITIIIIILLLLLLSLLLLLLLLSLRCVDPSTAARTPRRLSDPGVHPRQAKTRCKTTVSTFDDPRWVVRPWDAYEISNDGPQDHCPPSQTPVYSVLPDLMDACKTDEAEPQRHCPPSRTPVYQAYSMLSDLMGASKTDEVEPRYWQHNNYKQQSKTTTIDQQLNYIYIYT